MIVDKTLEMQTNENTVVFYKNKSEKNGMSFSIKYIKTFYQKQNIPTYLSNQKHVGFVAKN